MNWEIVFVGIGASLAGTIVGSLLTTHLTHRFQVRLLKQQLDAQRESHKELLTFLEQVKKDIMLRMFNDAKGIAACLSAAITTRQGEGR